MPVIKNILNESETEIEVVNSNEIISDYHFYLQLFLEEKELDFDTEAA